MITLRHKAHLVHLLTASGAVFSMLAMLAAADKAWDIMFLWLVVALVVDGVDGPLARHYHVKHNAPEYDGVLLDLIIDYLTYVFIPAFALFYSDLLPGWVGWICIITITFTSALYFSDTRMKTKDNSFAGFPGCWNMVVLVLFAIEPNFWVALAVVVLTAASMFTSLKFIHPVRTKRWRRLSLPIAFLWLVSAGITAWHNFEQHSVVTQLLMLSSLYLLLVGIVQQKLLPAGELSE